LLNILLLLAVAAAEAILEAAAEPVAYLLVMQVLLREHLIL
jgi:hypothetical protein